MAIKKNAPEAGKTVHTDNVNDTNNTDAGITAGGDLEASGAILEDDAKAKIDLSHDSVDDNPRAGTTVKMNQIDFNEPSAIVPQQEAVVKALEESGFDKSADATPADEARRAEALKLRKIADKG